MNMLGAGRSLDVTGRPAIEGRGRQARASDEAWTEIHSVRPTAPILRAYSFAIGGERLYRFRWEASPPRRERRLFERFGSNVSAVRDIMTSTFLTDSRRAVRIDFEGDVPLEQRALVERSIAAMAARSMEATSRVLAAESERAALAAEINRPLVKLIEGDPDAAKALGELQTRPQFDDFASLTAPGEYESLTGAGNAEIVLRGLTDTVEVPPYHYSWNWFHTAGSAPFRVVTERPSGILALDARSGGLVPGGANTFVEAHAGFGLSLPSRHCKWGADSVRRMRHSFAVGAQSLGGNATSEGGVECTVMEDANLLTSASHKLWRSRVSGFESDHGGSGADYITDSPLYVEWVASAGHYYTFNVGIWAFSDTHSGVGSAGAQALIEGFVPTMTDGRIVCFFD
ncbi:hypothetical protein [Embleya sp. NPDC059237]|uniref:hypothetical protein n=1 Tax=Embleya sp. NPDC059237 TaxID=3346784 RepID=UPI00367CCB86